MARPPDQPFGLTMLRSLGSAELQAAEVSAPSCVESAPSMFYRHLRPSVDEDYARTRLGAGWTMRFRRWWAARRDPIRAAKYPSLELVWLPAYRVTIPLESPTGVRAQVCSVEGRSGSFALTDTDDALVEGAPDGQCFEPVLSETEAETAARRELLNAILRRRGRAGKPTPLDTERIELVAHPYWVYYFLRGRHIDIRVLDAVTGQLTGNKIRLALFDAFRALS